LARGDLYREREVTVGLAPDVARYGDLWPWDIPGTGPYVGGAFDDSSPYVACLWADLNRCLQRAGVSSEQAAVFGWSCLGVLPADIVRIMPVEHLEDGRHWIEVALTPERASYHIREARRKLLRSGLGLLTVIYEQCGGWRAVRELFTGR
jgi:hypothetical protein